MDSSKIITDKRENKEKTSLAGFIFSKLPFLDLKPKKSWQIRSDLDKKLIFSLSKSRLPSLRQLKYLKKFLSPAELFVVRACAFAIVLSLVFSSYNFYREHWQPMPIKGGEYAEGLIGAPKYINPLYSRLSDADNDLASLIFSSLFARDKNGQLVGDLTDSYSISADSKVYTIIIKEDVKWHSGGYLTADDVVFTFNAIKDSKYKSPFRSRFNGVEIEAVDQKTIRFTLAETYVAFLESLTFGIMPSEIWNQIPPESANLVDLNLKPIGSGPYKFSRLTKDSASGAIIDYVLEPNDDYYLQPALIKLRFKFYPNFEEAAASLKSNAIDGLSYLPKELEKEITATNSYNFFKLAIPQLSLIYFNPKNNSALGKKELRHALSLAIDKAAIINEALSGEANAADSPIIAESFAYSDSIKKYPYNPEEAGKILDGLGWAATEITAEMAEDSKQKVDSQDEKEAQEAGKIIAIGAGHWRAKDGNYLTVRLATVDRVENYKVAEAVKKYWENVGVKTELEAYPSADMQKTVIKPRNFEALFYSIAVGSDPDPYAFWHSSQAGGNGLNIANFSNKEADQLLEDARLVTDKTVRQEKYKRFQEIITEEAPVIFMYSPTYTYLQSKKVKNFQTVNIIVPSDRFSNVNEWYINTGKKIIW